jgi:NAD(P) transhydrogenase subunit alpha
MNEGTLILYAIYIFMLAVFVGFEVISKVPVQLHTPLMSGTNAIHGIVMLGGMLVLAESGSNGLLMWLGFAAVVLGAMNLFGGFVVTDRMLEMFKTKKPATGGK